MVGIFLDNYLYFPDSVWGDPSLVASNTALVTSSRTQVLPITQPPGGIQEETEPEPRVSAPRALADHSHSW
jgi:hypothetical protein